MSAVPVITVTVLDCTSPVIADAGLSVQCRAPGAGDPEAAGLGERRRRETRPELEPIGFGRRHA